MTWLLVTEKDDRVPEIEVYSSLEEIEADLEEIDIENEEYMVWDSQGNRLTLCIDYRQGHWISTKPTGIQDAAGLQAAIRRYAEVVGIPIEEADAREPIEAVKRIEEFQERKVQERRGKRRWYQFWRSD